MHGQDLAGQVRDVGKLDHAGGGRDRASDPLDKLGGRGERNGESDSLDDNSLAAGALVPGGEHAGIIMVGDDHLVAPLQIDAQDQGLHPLGGVARDRQLLGVAAELSCQRAADGLDPRLEHLPHVVCRQLVREAQVANHLLEHVSRRGADTAVIEVDDRPIGVERALDLRPVIFVAREVTGRLALRVARRTERPSDRVTPERREGRPGGERAHEPAPRFVFAPSLASCFA